MIIKADGPFNYRYVYEFMSTQDDCMYRTSSGRIRRAERFGDRRVLFEISEGDTDDSVTVDILSNEGVAEAAVRQYVAEWLDLDYDLSAFYRFAEKDSRLSMAVKDLYGYRMTGKMDILEALVWSVLGQQINMKFAYVLKRRLVEHFGHHVAFEGEKYWIMPGSEELLALDIEVMRGMQISQRKSEYLKNCAQGIVEGTLSKEYLQSLGSYESALDHLISFRGIGPWSANTVLMRTLKFRNAVPIGDAGLKNAIHITDGLEEKPSKAYIDRVTDEWGEYGAYATLYMWRILG